MPTISSRDRITLKEWLKRYNRKVSFYDKETKTITVPTTLSSIYYLTDYEVVSSDSHSVFMKKRTTPLPELPSDQVVDEIQYNLVAPIPPEEMVGMYINKPISEGSFKLEFPSDEEALKVMNWLEEVSEFVLDNLSSK